jgi:hypothetical protein
MLSGRVEQRCDRVPRDRQGGDQQLVVLVDRRTRILVGVDFAPAHQLVRRDDDDLVLQGTRAGRRALERTEVLRGPRRA